MQAGLKEGTAIILQMSRRQFVYKAQLFPSSSPLSFPSLRNNPQNNVNASTCLVTTITSTTSTGLPVTTSSILFLLYYASRPLERVTGIRHCRHLDLASPHYPSIPTMPAFPYAFAIHSDSISSTTLCRPHVMSGKQTQVSAGFPLLLDFKR